MADFSAFTVSCGLSLLSNEVISNLTPAGLLLLNCSARNWKPLSWFWPVAAVRPVSASIQAILTVSPFCARAMLLPSARPAPRAMLRTVLRNVIVVS